MGNCYNEFVNYTLLLEKGENPRRVGRLSSAQEIRSYEGSALPYLD
jgi:hypothetical protein